MKNKEVQLGGQTKTRQVRDLYPVIKWASARVHTKNQLAKSLGQELKRPTAKEILDLIEKGAVQNGN